MAKLVLSSEEKRIVKIVEQGEAARKASTQGAWHIEDPMGDIELSIVIGDDPLDWQFIASVHHDGDMVSRQTEANAKFVTLSANHTAEILADWKRLRNQVKFLSEALADLDPITAADVDHTSRD